MRTTFIRHGQSTGNAGIPAHDLALLELTELGWEQSREVAGGWTEVPTLIVTSPYLRTQQTAQATIARFPDVPVEVWPVEEFTYLPPSMWNGTRSAERMPHIERYWNDADPEFCDGEGAESFGTLLGRAEAALDRLAAMPEEASVYVFSHGQFIQAVRSLVVEPELTVRGRCEGSGAREAPPSQTERRWTWSGRRGAGGTGIQGEHPQDTNDHNRHEYSAGTQTGHISTTLNQSRLPLGGSLQR